MPRTMATAAAAAANSRPSIPRSTQRVFFTVKSRSTAAPIFFLSAKDAGGRPRFEPPAGPSLALNLFQDQRAGQHFSDAGADQGAPAEGRALLAALRTLEVGLVSIGRQRD